ncbi:hypothetical protein POM88_023563 [Heracleum sosnowskyi]|uniref:Uncharacterized protein n=1 Tax=Heracleum sosnowskyi TaxID=360622 RepID=A0AAD8IJS6_9APIA|nr:hypothetical protein POM88_023563 [Heracleum sosnowskyi]
MTTFDKLIRWVDILCPKFLKFWECYIQPWFCTTIKMDDPSTFSICNACILTWPWKAIKPGENKDSRIAVSDRLIELSVGGTTVADIFKLHGESFFRDNEVNWMFGEVAMSHTKTRLQLSEANRVKEGDMLMDEVKMQNFQVILMWFTLEAVAPSLSLTHDTRQSVKSNFPLMITLINTTVAFLLVY